MDKKDIKNGDSREMRAILSQIAGWQNCGKNRKYYRNYGQQQYYERVGKNCIGKYNFSINFLLNALNFCYNIYI